MNNYLIASPSVYMGESLKVYKRLNVYNFFVSGWIYVSVVDIQSYKKTYLISTCVWHPQRVSVTPVNCRGLLTHNSPTVQIFTVEGNTQMKKTLTCTLLTCSWLPPAFHIVPFAKLAAADIGLSTPLQKCKKITLLNNSEWSRTSQQTNQAQTPTEEVRELYSELAKTGKPVALLLVPNYCENYVPFSAREFCLSRWPTTSVNTICPYRTRNCLMFVSRCFRAIPLHKSKLIRLSWRHVSSRFQ